VPLRSVEAATRDDAIAAAREQYGPSARVIGVRRVRSGGVLGFFATERYVAEVAPDAGARPMVPVPAAGRGSGSAAAAEPLPPSPLASAAPARARTAAPARNGAAAYAAVSASASTSGPARATSSSPAEPTRGAAALRAAAAEPAPRPEPAADEARLSELVGLLAAESEPPAAAYSRASFPRTTTISRARNTPPASFLDDEDDDLPERAPHDRPAVLAPAPSPFTAALARMVSGDREVRQAVEEALEQPASTRTRSEAEPRPTWPGPVSTAEPSVPSPATHQKEETVGDQVIAPPSMPAARPAQFPAWAAEPGPAATAVSSREEAIAEVLRSALAQGHSDEALAGILRKVLAGASPQTALAGSHAVVAAADLALPNLVADLGKDLAPAPAYPPAPVDELMVDTIVELPVVDLTTTIRAVNVPAIQRSVVEPPRTELPPVDLFGEAVPATGGLFPGAPARAEPTWAERAAQATLWGQPAAASSTPVCTDSPIWAEIVRREPGTGSERTDFEATDFEATDFESTDFEATDFEATDFEATDFESTDFEPVEFEATGFEPVEAAAEAVVIEDVEECAAVESVHEVVLEMAPLLARTASDPAPMSLDVTTVMPPLSLLPPLPGSRGRGRPPVPLVVPRAAAPSASPPSAPSAPSAPGSETPAVPAPASSAPAARSLATVTRLPVAPLMATPETPEMPERPHRARAPEAFAPEAPAAAPEAPAAAPAAPTREALERELAGALTPAARPVVRTPLTPPAAPGDVVSRLAALGVPAELLGNTFASDVAEEGTYAALTRALSLRLPTAPELPTGAGEVLFVVGPGVETLRAARSLAAGLRLDPERVQWATRGDLVGLAPEASRMATIDAAIDRRQAAAAAGTVTIVAVDAPMRTDAYWMAQMLAIWSPVAVWAVVEATRKPEDLEQWLDGLSRVDALIVQDTDLSADPAAVLRGVAAPVAVLDGVRATPHRWASLLCERLEGAPE
jgi:hypothetical protein